MTISRKQEVAARLASGELIVLGYQQITDLSSAVGLTVPDTALIAILQPEISNIRWRDDGTDPTASIGMIIVADNLLVYTGDLDAIQIIQSAAGAKLNVSYYA